MPELIPWKSTETASNKIYEFVKELYPPQPYPRLHAHVMLSKRPGSASVKIDAHVDEARHRINPFTNEVTKFFNIIRNC